MLLTVAGLCVSLLQLGVSFAISVKGVKSKKGNYIVFRVLRE